MFTVENQLYVRLILLLIRGGNAVLRKIVVNGLSKEGISLKEFLTLNKPQIMGSKHLTSKQLEMLYPKSSDPPDILKWDISLLCYFSIEFFTRPKKSSEHKAVSTIRDIRNQFCAHYPDASIDVNTYSTVWSRLTIIISTLSSGFSETDRSEINSLVKSATDAHLVMKTVMNEVQMFNPAADFTEQIQKQMEKIGKALDSYHRDVLNLRKQVEEIKTLMEESGHSTVIVNTVYGQVRLSALDKSIVDKASKWLLRATEDSLKEEGTPNQAVDNFIRDIEKTGVKIVSIREGSVLLTFKCSSLKILLNVIDYFVGKPKQERLDDIAGSLEELFEQQIQLTAELLLDPLHDIIKTLYKQTMTLNIGLECTTVDSLQHVLDVFEGDTASNSLNEVSNALSKDVGQHIAIETAVDIETMQGAITAVKQQLEKHQTTSKEIAGREIRITPYRVTLPLNIKMKPEVKLNKDMSEKMHTCVRNEIKVWWQECSASEELKCVWMDEITFNSNQKTIQLCFILKSDEDLEKFRSITFKPKMKTNLNPLSEKLTDYVEQRQTLLNCGISGVTTCVLKVVLPDNLYYSGKSHFSRCIEEEEEKTDSDSHAENKDDSSEEEVKKAKPYYKQEDSEKDDTMEELPSVTEQQSTDTNIFDNSENADKLLTNATGSIQVQDSHTPTSKANNVLITTETCGSDVRDRYRNKDIEESSAKNKTTIDNVGKIKFDSKRKCDTDFLIDVDVGSDSVKSLEVETKRSRKKNKIEHKFFVHLPDENRPISLHIEGSYEGFFMRPHPNSMYEVSVSLPSDLDPETIYVYNYHQQSAWNVFSPRNVSSCEFKIGKDIVHRDLISEAKVEKEMFHHFEHILLCSQCKYTEKQLCEQIDRISSSSTGKYEPDLKILVKKVSSLKTSSDKCNFLLAVIIAGLCNPGLRQIESMVDDKLANHILLALSDRSIKDLAKEVQFKMHFVCRKLSEIRYGNRWCPLLYLESCYPFLDEDLVLKCLKENLRLRKQIAPDHFDTKENCKSFCEKLFQKCYQNPDNDKVRRILTLILENIPKNVAISMFHEFQFTHEDLSECEQHLKWVLADTVKKVVKKSISDLKTKRELSSLIQFAKEACQGTTDEIKIFCEEFENAIIEILQFTNPKMGDNIMHDLRALFLETNCFKQPRRQEKLLEIVVESGNEDIFKLFYEMFDFPGLLETYEKLSINVYTKWLQTDKVFWKHRKSESLLSTLSEYCQIQKIAESTRRSDVLRAVEGLIATQLRQVNAKVLLRDVGVVEKLCDSNDLVGGLFKTQVFDNLKSIGPRPYDILQLICGEAIGLCIKHRFTADLIGTIIDSLLKKQEHQTEFGYFCSLTVHVKCLKLIANATGNFQQTVLQNKTYQLILENVRKVTQHIKAQEVSLPFVQFLDGHEHKKNARKLMKLQDNSNHEIDLSFRSCFDEVDDTARCIVEVLCALEKKKPELLDILSLKKKALNVQQRIQEGNTLAVDCRPENQDALWGILKPFQRVCKDLKVLIKSDVLWNLTMPSVDQFLNDQTHFRSEPDCEAYIRYLFDKQVIEQETHDCVLNCLHLLMEKGKPLFQKGWINLEDDSTLQMDKVMSMFKSVDVAVEIDLASDILGRSIQSSTQATLKQLFTRNDVLERVKTMKLVLGVFCPENKEDSSFQKAAESFENLCRGDMSAFKFKEVEYILETVYDQAKVLTEDSLLIMTKLGSSSHLIEFLRSIADDDIRTLIDAVEHISEQHVQEKTVSSLIEVKRFVYPFMDKNAVADKGSHWLFETINRQVLALNYEARLMVSRIDDCMHNIHSLRVLIDNTANRGELTKEVVSNIVKKGKILFKLDTKEKCVIFQTNYTQNNKKIMKDEKTVIDLRSRVLLLVNTDSTSQKSSYNRAEFRTFVDSVDLCSDVKDILSSLFSSGHVKYTRVKISNAVEELRSTKERLLKDLEDWNKDLRNERKNFYLLNFINGRQIPILNHYLEKGEGEEIVRTILKSIHPEIRTENVRKSYTRDSHANRDMLKSMGYSLQSAHFGLQDFRREIKQTSEYGQQITDIVHTGKVRIVNLECNSAFVIKTVLALYKNTTQKFPESHQMLFCNKETRWSDIELLLERCKRAPVFYSYCPLFCIAHAEKLRREIQDKFVQAIDAMAGQKCLLAIVCQGTEHLFRSKVSEQIETVRPLSDEELKIVLQKQYPSVFTYTSDTAGLGKTTLIYSSAMTSGYTPKTIHISGTFRKGKVIEQLRFLKLQNFHSLHLDIGSLLNPKELDIFLFELIILSYVSEDTAFYLEAERVYIEISNTINDTLLNALQFTTSFKRVHIDLKTFDSFLPSREITSATQVVCHYLNSLDKGTLDKKEIHFTGNHKLKPLEDGRCRTLLAKYIQLTGETSYNNIHIFLNVLSEQLKKLSVSAFFRNANIFDMMDGGSPAANLRSTLVNAMIYIALEFASRSVKAVRSVQSKACRTELNGATNKEENIVDKAVLRVKYMIRWEDTNHLMFVFHNQNIQTLTPIYRDVSRVEEHVKKLFERQMNKPLINFTDMDQNELQGMLQKIARKDITPLSDENLKILANDYVLTSDNVLKMILIMMRIQANVPVILMGETGCGKTSLIRYLSRVCNVQCSILNIHAGVTLETIVQQIEKDNGKCYEQYSQQKWLFLDEINTSRHIGVISDAICHRRCNGKVLAPNLIIMGACNPYKLKSEHAIRTAGLEGKVRSDELSRLVYRVLPLPETMIDYVWDFGSLSEKDEETYIQKMISDVFTDKTPEHILFTKLLTVSQSFVRDTENATFSVSLRDVFRCKRLVEWFATMLLQKQTVGKDSINPKEIQIRSIILALAHCFHSRFAKKLDRRRYRQVLESVFVSHGYHKYKENNIHSVIKDEQNDVLHRMDLPPGIARNTALQENVFMLLVCILNKIPIFLVGKPGCSKSLAMQVIRSNIRGKDSKDEFFKTLPQLYCVSFQGSESSTSEGISTVFEKAEQYQMSYAQDDVLSVVILDEIGLAEISEFNPLKVLHNLLEPDGQSTPNVAVVGISNWALDASKMNRAIHLSRPDMDTEELIDTGIFISESFTQDIQPNLGLAGEEVHNLSTDDIRENLKYVAKAYSSYTRTLKFKNFHGLRDFYFLVKYITRTLAEEKSTFSNAEKAKVIMKGLQRNFGGLPKERPILLHHFQDCFRGNKTDKQSAYDFVFNDQSSTYDLVVGNIKDSTARHLMLIIKGESAFAIVEDILRDANRTRREIIFGSHFEDDLTDDYNYRTLSKIIMCMEQGIVLILKDLENIYGSLYDMLNQNYTRIGQKNNCRVALGPYSNPFCHVAESFRCIVLVDERKLDYTDLPFLNRFEKQFLSYGDIINQEKALCLKEIENWLEEFSIIECKSFTTEDMFPVYNEEMLVSLVIYNSKNKHCKTNHDIVLACKKELLWLVRPEAVIRLSSAVSSDLKSEMGGLKETYFSLPLHDGIQELIKYQMQDLSKSKRDTSMTIVFTNSNIHIKVEKYFEEWSTQFEKLQTFKSEKQLSSSIEKFWKDEKCKILFLQCSAVEDERHIILTKTIIERYGVEAKEETHITTKKLVYLAIHLEGNDMSTNTVSQINYLSGWKLLMMDTLEKPVMSLKELCSTDLLSIIERKRPLANYLKNELFWAFTRIRYGSYGRDHKSISTVLEKMKNDNELLSLIEERIYFDIRDNVKGDENTNWQIKVACDINALSTSAHFVEALECFVHNAIKYPLAKIVFRLETLGAIHSYFSGDEDRKRLWKYIFQNETLFSISEIQNESGPWCYSCDRADLSLVMPFSRAIFENIEATREDFLVEIPRLRAKCDINEDDALPLDVTNELVRQQQTYMFKKIPDLQEYEYDKMKTDYVEDFCNLVSYTTCASLTPEERIYSAKCVITHDINFTFDYSDIFARMHCIFWANARLFSSFLLLLESCVEVFEVREVLEIFEETVHKNGEEKALVPLTSYAFSHESDMFKSSQWQDNYASKITDLAKHSSYGQSKAEFDQSGVFVTENSGDSESTLRNDAFHQFISLVCSKVLPSETCLKKFDRDVQWQLKVRNVMTVAAEVSREPKRLHALRFCDDLATHFLFPLQQSISKLETIGNLLTNHELDSETVFKEIKTLLFSAESRVKAFTESQIHRLLSVYLIRCMTADPETTAYTFLFKLIKEDSIPDDCIGQYKAPLHFLFCLEHEVKKEFHFDLVKPDTPSWISGGGNPFSDSLFLSELNICLKSTLHSKTNGSFNILIVDLLEELYMEAKTDDYFDLLLKCGTILQTVSDGLQFIGALSLLKVIIARIAEMVSENKIQNKTAVLNALNATYIGIKEKDISQTLKIYFLKVIANNIPLNVVMTHHESLKQKCTSLDALKWTKNYIQVCIDRHPLSLFVSDFNQYEALLSQHSDKATMSKNILQLSDLSIKSKKGLLFLISLVQRDFYLKRFFETITDSNQRQIEMLAGQIRQSQHMSHTKQLLLCLIGKRMFNIDKFSHGVKTPSRQYFILSFLLSSYAVTIAGEQFQRGDSRNLFSMCLLRPKDLKQICLPGFPETTTEISKLFTLSERSVRVRFASCTSCSLRLAFETENLKQKCPICKKDLETETHYQLTVGKIPSKPIYGFFNFRYFVNEHFQVRDLSPVTCNVLYLFVKGYILGSVALKVSTIEEIFRNKPALKSYTAFQLWEDITIHWGNIAKLLNFDDHRVAVFLNVILYRADNLTFEYENKLTAVENRDDWEMKFDKIVRELEHDRFSVIIDHIRKCDEQFGFTKQTLELQIREADDITSMSTDKQNKLLPGLFRVSEKPSKSDFICQFLPVKNKYQFLGLVLSHENSLNLPQYIHKIIQWHLVTVVHTCFSLRSYECSKMTVQDFLDKIPEQSQRDLVKKRFEAFKVTWGKLTKALGDKEVFRDIQSINTQSSLDACLILEEKSNVFKVLSHLVNIQNEFIDLALNLSFVCDNLYFLSRDIDSQGLAIIKNLPITETRQEHFLGMSFNWDTKLKQEAYSHISYGQGRYVHYEFGSVEKELIAELLVGKAFLNLSTLPKILFTDQLFRKYVSLVEEVRVSVKQEPLPQGIVISIRKNNEDSRSMAKDLINYLDMVMTLLQKMKCESQMPLVDFAAERSNILGRPLPRNCLPRPESSIKLCHVVSLHELLEELCADSLIDGLGEKYCVPLDDPEMQEHFQNMPVISMKTAETVVRTLKRFVYRCMSLGETLKPEQPLIQYLSHKSFWPDNSFTDGSLQIENKNQAIENVIQTNVLVCHVQSIVLLLTDKIEKQKQGEEEKLETVITEWKTTQVKKEEDSKTLKRRKMLQFRKT